MLKQYNPLRYLKFQLNILLALEEFFKTIFLVLSLFQFFSKFISLRALSLQCPARPRPVGSAAAQCHLQC